MKKYFITSPQLSNKPIDMYSIALKTAVDFVNHKKNQNSIEQLKAEPVVSYFGYTNINSFISILRSLKDADVQNLSSIRFNKTLISEDNRYFRVFLSQFLLEIARQQMLIDNNRQSSISPEKLIAPARVRKGKTMPMLVTEFDAVISSSETQGKRDSHEDAPFVIETRVQADKARQGLQSALADIASNAKKVEAGVKERSTKKESVMVGSCALCAHIDPDKNLTLANIGDSRAVLYIQQKNGTFRAVRLSKDQKPSDPLELSHISSKGGVVQIVDDIARVNRILALARSLGDADLPVSQEPDIIEVNLNQYIKRGERGFLVLSCDGLYEDLNELDCCLVLGEQLKRGRLDHSIVSRVLTLAAWNSGSMDNITVLAADLDELSKTRQNYVFGVFDGHGGNQIAELGKEMLTAAFSQTKAEGKMKLKEYNKGFMASKAHLSAAITQDIPTTLQLNSSSCLNKSLLYGGVFVGGCALVNLMSPLARAIIIISGIVVFVFSQLESNEKERG